MKILIVSGFLGSGKTTFIKELVKRTQKKIVVMENEYGETNLDSYEISKESKVNVWELTEGCICCTMKDNFVSSILTVSAALDPEYLVVEPTGIGKLSNILSGLNKIKYEKIELLKPIVIVPPTAFFQNIIEYREIYTDQISNAGRIVFSKCENIDDEELRQITDKIKDINPNADIICRHYTEMTDEWWNLLLTDKSCEKNKYRLLRNSKAEFDEFTVKNARLNNPDELIALLQDLLSGKHGNICRAKGVIRTGSFWLRFDLADSLFSIIGCDDEKSETQCVFIGKAVDIDFIGERLNVETEDKICTSEPCQ